MKNSAVITNEDIGILFHPNSLMLRKKALAFIILRVIKNSRFGLTRYEIMVNLRNKLNWNFNTSNTLSDHVDNILMYLKNPPEYTFQNKKSTLSFVHTKLRNSDSSYVFQATTQGNIWVDSAKQEYDQLIFDVKKEVRSEIINSFEDQIERVRNQKKLIETLEDLVVNRLISIAFNDAKEVLSALNFSDNDINAFQNYYSEIIKNTSPNEVSRRIASFFGKKGSKKDKVLKSNLIFFINKIGTGSLSVTAWEQFIHAYTHNALLFTLLPFIPNTSLNSYLSKKIKNTKLCLDTNVLLSLILDFDRDHSLALEIFRTLQELGVQIFWHDLAEDEIRKKFSHTRSAVEAIKALPPARRTQVIKTVWNEGYINTFFRGKYRSTKQMEEAALQKLKRTKHGNMYARPNGSHFFTPGESYSQMERGSSKDKWSKTKRIFEDQIKIKFGRQVNTGVHYKHDVEILCWVYCLRSLSKDKIKPDTISTYIAHHWIVSIDKRFVSITNNLKNSNDSNLNQSLAISLKTLRLMIDPADILRAIKNSSVPKSMEEQWMDRKLINQHHHNISNLLKMLKEESLNEDIVAQFIREHTIMGWEESVRETD